MQEKILCNPLNQSSAIHTQTLDSADKMIGGNFETGLTNLKA